MSDNEEPVSDAFTEWLDMMGSVELPPESSVPERPPTPDDPPPQTLDDSEEPNLPPIHPAPPLPHVQTEVPSGSGARANVEDMWADPVKEVLKGVRESRGPQVRQVLLTLGCSGAASEARALKRMGIDFRILYLNDVSPECFNFCNLNEVKRDHYYYDLSELPKKRGGFCMDHKKFCAFVIPQGFEQPDTNSTGFTCCPYSTSNKRRPSGTRQHAESHLFDAWVDQFVAEDASEAWGENVFGVLNKESRHELEAPIRRMIVTINQKAPAWHPQVYFVDSYDSWILTRRRIFIHCLHQRVGGVDAHVRMTNYLKASLYNRAGYPHIRGLR